jgi:DNA repair protein RadA/Sms
LKKNETVFVCQNCGHNSSKWLGKCPECGEWNSLVEERAKPVRRGRLDFKMRDVAAVPYTDIESQDDVRISSGVTEFDRVLGGGI